MDNSSCSLNDKDIWVIGGAGYFGQALVSLLNKMGANILCVDLGNKAHQFKTSVLQNDRITPESLDVRNVKEMKEFVDRQMNTRGVPVGLVDLTFASTAKKLEELDETDFNDVNHGGITSTFSLVREIGTKMSQKELGSIVLFSSIYGMVSPQPEIYLDPMNKNPIEYGVGKAAIIQMTRYFAVHWGKNNVRCNCISPGPFPNPSVQKEHPDFIERLSKKSPMGRIGRPEEIAGAVAFLLSDAASYVTGHNLVIDGGWTCW